jgi:hypothetical protein
MLTKRTGRIGRGLILALFLAVNLAIANPVGAGWLQIPCPDPQGEEEVCCQYCVVFCGCPIE